MTLPYEYFPLSPPSILSSPLPVRVEIQSKQLVPGMSFSFDFKYNKMPTRLKVCVHHSFKKAHIYIYEESPEKPYLIDFSMYKRIIVTCLDFINDC